jgi:hypothetical protein
VLGKVVGTGMRKKNSKAREGSHGNLFVFIPSKSMIRKIDDCAGTMIYYFNS